MSAAKRRGLRLGRPRWICKFQIIRRHKWRFHDRNSDAEPEKKNEIIKGKASRTNRTRPPPPSARTSSALPRVWGGGEGGAKKTTTDEHLSAVASRNFLMPRTAPDLAVAAACPGSSGLQMKVLWPPFLPCCATVPLSHPVCVSRSSPVPNHPRPCSKATCNYNARKAVMAGDPLQERDETPWDQHRGEGGGGDPAWAAAPPPHCVAAWATKCRMPE